MSSKIGKPTDAPESSGPQLPFTEFRITDADTYKRAVRQAYRITDDGRGGWRSPFTYTSVIKPVFDQDGRHFVLEAWVQYWASIGMKERCVMAVTWVVRDRKEFSVPAELPWLFDPNWTMRVQVPAIPKKLLQRVGLVPKGDGEGKPIDLRKAGTEGFTRYKTREGREAFRWAALNLPPEPGGKVPSLADCYRHADAVEAMAQP